MARKPKPTVPMETVSIRIPVDLKNALGAFVEEFNAAFRRRSDGTARARLINEPTIYRWALEKGLESLRENLPKNWGRR